LTFDPTLARIVGCCFPRVKPSERGGVSVQEVEASWGRVLAICWLIFWRAFVGAFVMGFAVGLVIGTVGAISGFRDASSSVSAVGGTIIGFGWFLFVVRMALRKRYADFRIALVPLDLRVEPGR
jgi:hypothetical protein